MILIHPIILHVAFKFSGGTGGFGISARGAVLGTVEIMRGRVCFDLVEVFVEREAEGELVLLLCRTRLLAHGLLI